MILRGFSERTQKKYLYEEIKLYKHYNRSPAKLSQEMAGEAYGLQADTPAQVELRPILDEQIQRPGCIEDA